MVYLQYLHEQLLYGINVGKYTIVPWILWDMYDVGIGFLQFQEASSNIHPDRTSLDLVRPGFFRAPLGNASVCQHKIYDHIYKLYKKSSLLSIT